MQLVATFNGKFFRAQSVTESEIDKVKQAMLKDQEGLEFQTMTYDEFEQWLEAD